MEVPKFSVSRGDESQKCWLGGNDGGLWFDLLLRAVTSPTPMKVSHGFGHVSKMFSASLVTHPGPAPATSQGRGAQPQPPKEQFVASASYFISHNQDEFGPVVSVTALGAFAGCYHLPSNLSWDFWSWLPWFKHFLSARAVGNHALTCTASWWLGHCGEEKSFSASPGLSHSSNWSFELQKGLHRVLCEHGHLAPAQDEAPGSLEGVLDSIHAPPAPLLVFPTSDSPDFLKPFLSPQCFGKLGLGTMLGFS